MEQDEEKPIKIVRNMDYCNQTMVEICKKMGTIKQEFVRLRDEQIRNLKRQIRKNSKRASRYVRI